MPIGIQDSFSNHLIFGHLPKTKLFEFSNSLCSLETAPRRSLFSSRGLKNCNEFFDSLEDITNVIRN